MENLWFGLESIFRMAYYNTLALINHPIAWGFAFGFAASTMIHILVIAERAHHIPHMLTKKPAHAYKHLKEKHGLDMARELFEDKHHKMRITFYLLCVVVFGIAVALVLSV